MDRVKRPVCELAALPVRQLGAEVLGIRRVGYLTCQHPCTGVRKARALDDAAVNDALSRDLSFHDPRPLFGGFAVLKGFGDVLAIAAHACTELIGSARFDNRHGTVSGTGVCPRLSQKVSFSRRFGWKLAEILEWVKGIEPSS